MKLFATAQNTVSRWSRLSAAVLVALATSGLIACQPAEKARSHQPRDQRTDFASAFLESQAKVASTGALPPGESVKISETGYLFYRNNLNRNCLITATGVVKEIRHSAMEQKVIYHFYAVASTGEDAQCAPADTQCFQELADCSKVLRVVTDNLNRSFSAKLPIDAKEATELSKLTPYRL